MAGTRRKLRMLDSARCRKPADPSAAGRHCGGQRNAPGRSRFAVAWPGGIMEWPAAAKQYKPRRPVMKPAEAWANKTGQRAAAELESSRSRRNDPGRNSGRAAIAGAGNRIAKQQTGGFVYNMPGGTHNRENNGAQHYASSDKRPAQARPNAAQTAQVAPSGVWPGADAWRVAKSSGDPGDTSDR